jgi:type I restriction enzyme S subunit
VSCVKKKLKDCCVSISDGDHQPPPKAETGVPFVTISNIDSNNQLDFSDVMYVPEEYYDGLPANKKTSIGNILYSVVGSFGKPVYISNNDKFVFQRHIAILKPNDEVDGKFLYYTMLNPTFYRMADKLAIGCAQRTITLDALRNIVVDIPPIEKQKSITDVLNVIDSKIAVNNRINDNLAA